MENVLRARPGDSLQKLTDSAPEGAVILLAPGVYREKLTLRTPGLTLKGEGAVLSWDDCAEKRLPGGGPTGTFLSYTLAVCADGVTLSGITVENTAGQPELRGQQVALSVCGDRFRMERCTVRSTQDTLFLGPLPQDLRRRYAGFLPDGLLRGPELRQELVGCRIEGTVDFIFGSGAALLEDCELRSLRDARGVGYVAAPSHGQLQKSGFRFLRCRFTAEEGVKEGSVFLARPWKGFGMAEFTDCVYGSHIARAGFDPWGSSGKWKTARFSESPLRQGRAGWVTEPPQTL